MNLREAIGERELHHYTTYNSLEDILKDGFLKLSYYEGTKDGESQLSLVRPGMVNKENLSNLSSGASGGVKFIIDASKMSDNVRGAKFKTIAELPVMFKRQIEQMVGPSNKKNINKIMKELMSMLKTYPSYFSITPSHSTKEQVKKYYGDRAYKEVEKFIEKWNIKMTAPMSVMNVAKRYYKHTKEREGEERLTLKKKGMLHAKLPLNTKFMKIELTKPYPDMGDFYKRKMAKLIEKNKNLFVMNDIYKDIVKKKD